MPTVCLGVPVAMCVCACLPQLGLSFDWRIHAGAEPMSGTAEPERPEYLKGESGVYVMKG